LAVAVLVERIDALAQRAAPEFDVGGEVVGLAIEHEAAQPAAVGHGDASCGGGGWSAIPRWTVVRDGRDRAAAPRRSGAPSALPSPTSVRARIRSCARRVPRAGPLRPRRRR